MLNKSLIKRGVKACTNDACFYVKRTKGGGRLIVLAYVDEIYITGDLDADIKELIKSLSDEYRRPNGSDGIEDRGVLEWFLGMRVRRGRKRRVLTVDHSQYITDMLEKYDLKDAAPRLHCRYLRPRASADGSVRRTPQRKDVRQLRNC
jgi:hypothetical protein